MATLNYAQQYSNALANAYPNVLNFGRLWTNQNANTYRVVDAKTIQIPTLTVGGRKNGDRDTIGSFSRNFNNGWETKTLSNHRIWETLVHPKDVVETNKVATIQNITKTMNETQKFPEMDAMTISTLFKLKNEQETVVAETVELTTENILARFDAIMDEMDEALVPSQGRLMYVDTFTKTMIDNAMSIVRANGQSSIARSVTRLEEVDIIQVPSKLMKTKYTFDNGFAVASDAKDIAMMIVHPTAILPIASYEFASLQAPSALTQGKYVYFEESFEDIFILNERHDAIKFIVKSDAALLEAKARKTK